MPTEEIDMNNMPWALRRDLEKAISSNCVEVPYEGTTVDQNGILNDIFNVLELHNISLSRHTDDENF